MYKVTELWVGLGFELRCVVSIAHPFPRHLHPRLQIPNYGAVREVRRGAGMPVPLTSWFRKLVWKLNITVA